MTKLLLIDDDTSLVDMLSAWLTDERYTVEVAYDGEEGLSRLLCCDYDLVVLDWELPGLSGTEVLKQFRSKGGNTPIIMLTGKNTISDKEEGLDVGADDYLTKPFAMRELSARLRAMMRRSRAVKDNVLESKDIVLDPAKFCVMRNGAEIMLLPREFQLLEFLMRHVGQFFTSDALLNRVWHSDADVTAEAVRSTIKRLRQKIDIDGEPSVIENIPKVGYRFRKN